MSTPMEQLDKNWKGQKRVMFDCGMRFEVFVSLPAREPGTASVGKVSLRMEIMLHLILLRSLSKAGELCQELLSLLCLVR